MNVNTTTITNSSITLIWEYPPSRSVQAIQSFLVSTFFIVCNLCYDNIIVLKVTYSGEVEWRSPGGYLIQFEDTGEVSVTDTAAVVSPLIPGTSYQFRVSAITSSGRGGEVASFETTLTSQDGNST